MKNKKNIILLVLVVTVWGTIGYRVYSAQGDGTVRLQSAPGRSIADSVLLEEYVFRFDYDDPFLKSSTRKEVTRKSGRSVRVKPSPEVQPTVIIPWESIRYFGVLYNASRKNKAASMKFNDDEMFLREGEQVGNFTLLEILPDSVKIGYGTHTNYVKKEK